MPTESAASRGKRAGKIIDILKARYPDAACSLDFQDPLQLLVATILSAQCTDQRVNIVTKDLFARYTTVEAYAKADPKKFEGEIRSTGFFRNKTKSILGAARKLVDEFGGQVPRTMEELLTLPGVARKTANVVLGNAFGINEGVVVDTHVSRLAVRLKLTDAPKERADKIEQDLMALAPRDDWALFAHLLVFHGRNTCMARKPDCAGCPVQKLCPSAFTFGQEPPGKSKG